MFEIDELAKIFDYVIVSPGVSPDNIFFRQAVLQNILLCDIDLLYLKFPNAFCIGVTGTNGKSTSVTLLQRAINSCGLNYVLGGNIGICYHLGF